MNHSDSIIAYSSLTEVLSKTLPKQWQNGQRNHSPATTTRSNRGFESPRLRSSKIVIRKPIPAIAPLTPQPELQIVDERIRRHLIAPLSPRKLHAALARTTHDDDLMPSHVA